MFSITTEPQTWGKKPSFVRVHSRVFPGFSQTNRPEPARKVIQDDKVTQTNLYEGPVMFFLASPMSFSNTTEPQTWEKIHHLFVFIAEFSLVLVNQIDMIQLEKLFKMIKSLTRSYIKDLTNFWPLLSRF